MSINQSLYVTGKTHSSVTRQKNEACIISSHVVSVVVTGYTGQAEKVVWCRGLRRPSCHRREPGHPHQMPVNSIVSSSSIRLSRHELTSSRRATN